MNFYRTKNKLEEVRLILEQLKSASNSIQFRALFNSFLTASRSVTNALQKEGCHLPAFVTWYAGKREQMAADELMRFIHEARTEDFHEGQHRLNFSTYIEQFHADVDAAPFPNAAIGIGSDGLFWLVDRGLPTERRIPIKQGKYLISASIKDGPRIHLGKPIIKMDPITICSLAYEYLQQLVHEAGTIVS